MKPYAIISALALLFVSCTKDETVTTESTAPPVQATMDAKPYPLKTCLVSGEELGSMGNPISIVLEGQTIQFCCDNCVPKFRKDPEKYIAKMGEMTAE